MKVQKNTEPHNGVLCRQETKTSHLMRINLIAVSLFTYRSTAQRE